MGNKAVIAIPLSIDKMSALSVANIYDIPTSAQLNLNHCRIDLLVKKLFILKIMIDLLQIFFLN